MRELAKKYGFAVEIHELPIGEKPAYNLTKDDKSVCAGHFYKVLEFLRSVGGKPPKEIKS